MCCEQAVQYQESWYNRTRVLSATFGVGAEDSAMVYELREWFNNDQCLYTDDSRVKDLAVLSSGLRIASVYFKDAASRQPFAWDIVGDKRALGDVARRFGSGRRSRAMR